MLKKLFLFAIFTLFFFHLSHLSVSAQSFGCHQDGPLEPCLLDSSYGCDPTIYNQSDAVDYCANLSGTDCYPVSSYISCSVLPTNPPIPTNTVAPGNPSPTPIPHVCSYDICNTDPNSTVCPNISPTLCCHHATDCPAGTPTRNCVSNGECQVDWDGGAIDGGQGGVFDVFLGCSVYSCTVAGVPDTAAKCVNDSNHTVCDNQPHLYQYFCDAGGGQNSGIDTGLGCIPYWVGPFTSKVLAWVAIISLGVAMTIILIAAGIFITSGGQSKKIQASKELLLSGIGGIIMTIISLLLINFLGVNILHLQNLGFSVTSVNGSINLLTPPTAVPIATTIPTHIPTPTPTIIPTPTCTPTTCYVDSDGDGFRTTTSCTRCVTNSNCSLSPDDCNANGSATIDCNDNHNGPNLCCWSYNGTCAACNHKTNNKNSTTTKKNATGCNAAKTICNRDDVTCNKTSSCSTNGSGNCWKLSNNRVHPVCEWDISGPSDICLSVAGNTSDCYQNPKPCDWSW